MFNNGLINFISITEYFLSRSTPSYKFSPFEVWGDATQFFRRRQRYLNVTVNLKFQNVYSNHKTRHCLHRLVFATYFPYNLVLCHLIKYKMLQRVNQCLGTL